MTNKQLLIIILATSLIVVGSISALYTGYLIYNKTMCAEKQSAITTPAVVRTSTMVASPSATITPTKVPFRGTTSVSTGVKTATSTAK